jgi:hypothetical protein
MFAKALRELTMTVDSIACEFEDFAVSDEYKVGVCTLPDGVSFLTEKHSTLFVRDFYGALHARAMKVKASGMVNVAFVGNAGIGKSWSAMYTLARLAKDKKKVIFEHVKLGKAWVFDFSDGGAAPREFDVDGKRTVIENLPEASDPEAFYLVDSGEEHSAVEAAPIAAFTIVYASPRDYHFKGMLKRMDHGPTLFLPTWHNIEARRVLVDTNVMTESMFDESFGLFDGVMRHLCAKDQESEVASLNAAVGNLAVRGSLAKAIQGLEAMTDATIITHYLLHFVAARQDTEPGLPEKQFL